MGSSSSKQKTSDKEELAGFRDRIQNYVETQLYQRAMLQREVQMAVNIAKARDTLQIFGSLWLALVSGVGAAKLAGKPVPSVASIPIVVGGIVLANIADMAYGNKLQRVNREAEYILEYEKARFVPFKQAPFRQFYTEEEAAERLDQATAVGDLWPSSMYARSLSDNMPNSDKEE